jgi:hypothetical protein
MGLINLYELLKSTKIEPKGARIKKWLKKIVLVHIVQTPNDRFSICVLLIFFLVGIPAIYII